MKTMRIVAALLAALFAAACLPVTTKSPAGTTVGFRSDPALIGVWKGRNDKGAGYIAFLGDKDATMTALLISPDEKDAGEWEAFSLRTATLGTNRFMNAREVLKDGKPNDDELAKTDILLLYRFEKNGKLALYLMDEDAAKAAIKAGKIAGTVAPGDFGDARVTAEPAALDAFLQTREGLALFTKPLLVLSKVK